MVTGDAPFSLAACTYFLSLRLSVRLLVTREYHIQSTSSIAIIMLRVLAPNSAIISMIRITFGKDISALQIVLNAWSTMPPRYAAFIPRIIPMNTDTSSIENAIPTELRIANIHLQKMHLP